MGEFDREETADLLQRYAESGDEAAFAAIVERYKGLVFSAALRRLGSVQLAEEAAQTTFAIVARKARSLQNVTHHAAWIHRTATQVARTIARTEARHRKKMSALIEHGDFGDGDDPDAWVAVHPHLDEALEALPERDRRVLMLRFFDGLSFREVAERIGKSEAAAQRQGHRALEKLARRLRRSGAAAASVSLLAAGLGAQLATPAPAELATAPLANSSLAAAPSLGGGTIFTNTLYTMSQAKTVAAAAAVVAFALIPLGMQRAAIASEKSSIALLEKRQEDSLGQSASSGSSAPSALSGKRGDRGADGADLNRRIRIADWLDELEAFMDGGDLDKVGRASAMLNSLPERDRGELAALLEEAQTMEIERPALRSFVVQALCEKIALAYPDMALDVALDLDIQRYPGKSYIVVVTLAARAEVGSGAVVDAFLEADAAGRIGTPPTGGGTFASTLFRDPVVGTLFDRMHDLDEAEAARLFRALGTRDRRVALMSRNKDFGDPAKRAPLIELALSAPDAGGRMDALDAVAHSYGMFSGYGDGSLDLVRDLAERGELSAEEGARLMVSSVKHFLQPFQKPENAIAWLRENSPPEFAEANVARARALRDAYAAERKNR